MTLFIFVGGWGQSDVERVLDGAHRAAARDLLEVLLATGMIGQAVVATDDAVWGLTLGDLPVEIDLDPPGEEFHFGQRLAGLIERHAARRILYCGGASAPLLNAEQWRTILARLCESERLLVTNNLHSCDWVALTPADVAAARIAGQVNDNSLAWMLAQHGLPAEALPASAATRFDLDTPADLWIARRDPRIGPHLRRFLDGLGWGPSPVDAVLDVMRCEGSRLTLIGRVSGAAWAALEGAARWQVRVFAEERGMRANGRQERGEVRSLVADYLDVVGEETFFDALARFSDGVFFDDRVLMAARGIWPTTADRFNSDLGNWRKVKEPFLRRFTRAAVQARMPVVLGGHSLVSGGLVALVELFRMEQAAGQEEVGCQWC